MGRALAVARAAAVEKPAQHPRAQNLRAEPLGEPFEAMKAKAVPKTPPGPDDWLAQHPESGQSLMEYRRAVKAGTFKGKTLYLMPLGALDARQTEVVERMAALMRPWFQLPVKVLPALDPKFLGASERRTREWGEQWLAPAIITQLEKSAPADSAGLMAVTATDLYPDPEWNFVFGQASYETRVGVMSLFRNGDLEKEPALYLRRAFATGAHELFHMQTVLHCVAWECPMNGCNHQQESDTRPLELCPSCLAKLAHGTGMDPLQRAAEARAVFADAGMPLESVQP
jgi:archaemetzincin